ncbi:MAG: aminotransferase class I/II-fold pyridoxal phosphate-dependent enzyme [marine benthic group bacterium]|nr:aminotransferase class I/II-fold pyridoxal phosphate-dependent enzyme [Gemmatimonadota bacterium]
MRFRPFEMERWQSLWENRVRYNLSESGVSPFSLSELSELTGADPAGTVLGYGHTEGSPLLRERIAALYPGATPEEVLVTSGSAEANFVACWSLIEAGGRVVIVTPTYGQTPGLAESLGAEVVELPLEEDRGWQPAPGAAASAIGPGTRLVVITNPNNPTGAVLTPSSMAEIIEAAERAGAWILADEVYRGAELAGPETESLWDGARRTIVTASLSKAYGLPGLRIGWLVADRGFRDEVWARKDYTTITPSVLCDRLATAALETENRAKILARTREILVRHLSILDAWAAAHAEVLRYRPPDAGAIALFGYDLPVGSAELAERLKDERDTLLVPGIHFGLEGHFRVGFGYSEEQLRGGLEALSSLLSELTETRIASSP